MKQYFSYADRLIWKLEVLCYVYVITTSFNSQSRRCLTSRINCLYLLFGKVLQKLHNSSHFYKFWRKNKSGKIMVVTLLGTLNCYKINCVWLCKLAHHQSWLVFTLYLQILLFTSVSRLECSVIYLSLLIINI